MSIIIFSKAIHSGKTTELMRYFGSAQHVGGILMPDVDGSRKLYNIETKEYFDVECKDPSVSTRSLVTIGRFYFYEDAFEKANAIIEQAAPTNDLLIIDEVGRLEMEGKGFYQSVKNILQQDEYANGPKLLLLVVRDSLYKHVLAFFEIANHRLINKLSDI